MEKILAFIKENWTYLLVMVAVVGFLLFLFILNKANKVEPIQSPFVAESNATFAVSGGVSGFPSKAPVFSADRFDDDDLSALIEKLGVAAWQKELDTDDVKQWISGDDSVTYNVQNAIFYVNSKEGLRLDIPLEGSVTAENVGAYFQKFVSEYIPTIPKNSQESSQELNGRFVVNGNYVLEKYKDVSITSAYLEDFAYEAEFSDLGYLYSLTILLIKNVNLYRNMPMMSSSALIQDIQLKSFPRLLFYDVTSENYDSIPVPVRASISLNKVELSSSRKTWVYVDDEYNLIVPAYRFTGAGTASDSQGNLYNASVVTYFCGIDPSYLLVREKMTTPAEEPSTTPDETEGIGSNTEGIPVEGDPVGFDGL